MTALDPTPIVRELNEEMRALGQFRPETVRRLIAATERTGQWPRPGYLNPADPRTDELVPFPRGGRTTYPGPATTAKVLSFPSNYCSQRHPNRALLCGEAPDHRGSHVAYGREDRILDEWPVESEAGA